MINHPDFQSIETLYSGVNSVLYRAVRASDGKRVILKTPIEATDHKKEAYAREISIMKRISSLDELELLDFDGIPSILLTDFDGSPLEERLSNEKHLSPVDFFPVAKGIVAELQSIHEAGILHRDLKPSNILVGKDPTRIRIIDFGSAILHSGSRGNTPGDGNLSGTLEYTSPEQTGRMNSTVDERSDLYSLGITFYRLLTGRLPFTGKDPLDLLHAHLARIPLPVDKVRAEIPEALGRLVDRLIQKDPDERYQSAEALLQDLERLQPHMEDFAFLANFQPRWQGKRRKLHFTGRVFGRESELTALHSTLLEVKETGGVRITLISGEPGSGKTSLVNEIMPAVFGLNARFITGRFDTNERANPYAGLIPAFETLVRQLLVESEEKLAPIKEEIGRTLGTNLGLLTEMVPLLARITGPAAPVPELGFQEAKNRLFLTLRSFLQIFASKRAPLVLFLDDLHGADEGSLEFVDHLFSSPPSGIALWIVGTSRLDHPDSPVPRFKGKWGEGDFPFFEITLSPLSDQGTALFLKSILGENINDFDSMTRELHTATKGNPFYLRIILESMEADGSLAFDGEHESWQWKPSTEKGLKITGGMGDLLAHRFQNLSPVAADVLSDAALIGRSFSLSILSLIRNESIDSIRGGLEEALTSRFLIGEFEDPTKESYSFSHDLIRERALASLSESRKKEVHSILGSYYQKQYENGEEGALFDALKHLNRGIDGITESYERIELARLNLKGGDAALGGASFDLAHNFYQTGLELIEKSSPENKELHLSLLSGATRSAAALKNADLLDNYYDQGLALASDPIEKTPFVDAKHTGLTSQYRFLEAFTLFQGILSEFGMEVPETVTPVDIQKVIAELNGKLGNQSIETIRSLPPMVDPNLLASLNILHSLFVYLPSLNPMLLPYLASKILILTLEHGLHPRAADVPGTVMSLTYFMVLGDIDLAYQMGKIAIDFYEHPQPHMEPSAITAPYQFNTFIRHWKEPLHLTIPEFQSFYIKKKELGDFMWAALSLFMTAAHSLYVGDRLSGLYDNVRRFIAIVGGELKEHAWLFWLQIYEQPVYYLYKGSFSGSFEYNQYSEEALLARFEQTKDSLSVFYHNLNVMILRYLWGDSQGALEYSQKAEEFAPMVMGMYLFPLFYFYDALVRLDLARNMVGEEREAHLTKVAETLEKFKGWAGHSPANHLHKWHLLEAERLRVAGEPDSAESHYDKAADLASEAGFPNEAALALQRMGEFLIEKGEHRRGRHYIRDAFDELGRWEAFGLQSHLIQKFPFLRTKYRRSDDDLLFSGTVSESTMGDRGQAIDLGTLLNASRQISRQLQYHEVIQGLMETIVKSAGAKRSILFLLDGSRLVLKARGGDQDIEFFDSDDLYLQTLSDVPETIIYYVLRTGETLLLDDALQSDYKTDSVVKKEKIRSVVVLPLAVRNELIGILYLENNLVSGVFSKNRVSVLEHLSSQTAIALQNASLYQDLEREVEERTRELKEAQGKLIRLERENTERIMAGGFAHEMRNALSGARLVMERAMGYDQAPPESMVLRSKKRMKRIFDSLSGLLPPDDLQNVLEIMRENYAEEQKLEEILKIVDHSLRRGLHITYQILEYSRIGSEQTGARTFNLSVLVGEVLEDFKNKAMEHGVEIIESVQPGISVVGYESHFTSMLQNLLQNSLDALNDNALPEGHQKNVMLNIEKNDRNIRIFVKDTGTGIRPEHQGRIFETFFSTKHDTGTGLGLKVVEKYVSNYGGKITFNSQYGEGTEFVITIPVHDS